MKFIFEILILLRHKWFTNSIYKDLFKICNTNKFSYDTNCTYNNILENIYTLIAKYSKDIYNDKEKISKNSFLKTLKKQGKGTRIALVTFIIKSNKIKNEFPSQKDFQKYEKRICQIVESIHNLSLVVDDVLDNELTRRNQLCVHVKYGQDGVYTYIKYWLDLIFYLILDLPVNNNKKNNCLKLLDKTCIDVIKYVEMEIKWEKNNISVDWDILKKSDIEEIYFQKTVRIFLLGFEFIQETLNLNINEKQLYINVITKLGFYLQRINDLENFNHKNDYNFYDILNKRVILLNFHKEIQNNPKLKALRYQAYKSDANSSDIQNYGKELLVYGIPQLEMNNLKELKVEIYEEIKLNFKSLWDNTFLMLIFKIYSRKLQTNTFF